MTQTKFLLLLLFTVFIASCSKDEAPKSHNEFVVAFENQSVNLSNEEISKEIKVVFSVPAPQDGSLLLVFQPQNLTYGNDFTTIPSAESGTIVLPVEKGSEQISFTFNKLSNNPLGNDPEKSVEFSFGEIQIPNGFSKGNTTLLINFSESASQGGNLSPEVGGPNQPNQVYIDLSGQTETAVRRDMWDLKFYNGDEFRVKLNSSMFMMAAEMENTDLNAVSQTDVENLQPQMAFLVAGSEEFVDHPSGNLQETAISEISLAPAENKVYLLKMGHEIGTDVPEAGSVSISGESRGWMKIRVLRQNDTYILQYAEVDANSFQEINIQKSGTHHFTFFSFATESIVNIAPIKENWDLKFTTFTEVEELPSGGWTAYGYSDYVTTNILSNVKAYQVSTLEIGYENFSRNDVVSSNFEVDQRSIGANWRNVFDQTVFSDRFFVIEDTEGNWYKLKFDSMVNENGVRGFPKVDYTLLD